MPVVIPVLLLYHNCCNCRQAASRDLQLGPREVTIKVVKVEVPMLHMVPMAGERYGELYCLGADKCVHHISLPTEGQAWAGIKGRMHKSLAKVGFGTMAALSVYVLA